MKVLVLGNSHAAALKQGFDRIDGFPDDLDLTWFTAAGQAFYNLRYSKDDNTIGLHNADRKPDAKEMLVRRNGATHISLAPFDRILIAGHTNGFVEIVTLLGQFGVEAVQRVPQAPTLTWDGFVDCLDCIIASRLPKWDPSVTGLPVDLISSPRLTDDVEQFPGKAPKYGFCGELRKDGDGFRDCLNFAQDRYATRAAQVGIHVFEQPAATVSAQTGLTLPEFNQGTKGLDGGTSVPDGSHANADYGVLAASQYLEHLKNVPVAVHSAKKTQGPATSARKSLGGWFKKRS